MKYDVRICEKAALSIQEAALYSNIGQGTLRDLAQKKEYKKMFFHVGKKLLVKRCALDEFIKAADYIDSKAS